MAAERGLKTVDGVRGIFYREGGQQGLEGRLSQTEADDLFQEYTTTPRGDGDGAGEVPLAQQYSTVPTAIGELNAGNGPASKGYMAAMREIAGGLGCRLGPVKLRMSCEGTVNAPNPRSSFLGGDNAHARLLGGSDAKYQAGSHVHRDVLVRGPWASGAVFYFPLDDNIMLHEIA